MDPIPDQKTCPASPLKPPRKRKRIVISCTECHRRKQKCDRASPCSNCVARNKHSLCHYENETARKAQLLEESGAEAGPDGGGMFRVIKPAESENAAQIGAFGYTKSNGNNNTSLGIFKKIESQDVEIDPMMMSPAVSNAGPAGLKEKYKSYIRQLPSKQHVEKLLVTYFREGNYQYYPLDEGLFRDQLKEWYDLSFSTLNKGPSALSADMQFFPALLFQVLALALQFQLAQNDASFESLKYAAGMTFDDLASDYSESGCLILGLLGKRQTTLTTVQAGFLRVTYLKNCGLIPESWHYLSQTIRDAQEIELHKETNDERVRRPDDNPEDVLEGLWMQQLRRRMWLILSLWDIHMGIVLGRPTSIDTRDKRPTFPIDAPISKNRRQEAPRLRTESDPPTPLTVLLWTTELGAPMFDIYNLEKEDPHQNNFARVEKMHKLIEQISLHCPPFFRAKNPDTRFDSLEECHWLPRVRAYFQSNTAFPIMALHRPYIYTNPSSRSAALGAGLTVLRSQRGLFNLLNSKHYKMYSLVLSTFDAIVLVAAIYILYPTENPDSLEDTLQHVEWSMERFETMSDRNSMAKSALGVMRAISARLQKVLGNHHSIKQSLSATNSTTTSPPSDYPTPSSNPQLSTPSAHLSISSSSSYSNGLNQHVLDTDTPYTMPTISNMTDTITPSGWETFSGGIPQDFDFSAMAPLQPMHDLVFNDLGGTIGGYDAGNSMQMPQMMDNQWQFAGDFGNDSFWGFMNAYNP